MVTARASEPYTRKAGSIVIDRMAPNLSARWTESGATKFGVGHTRSVSLRVSTSVASGVLPAPANVHQSSGTAERLRRASRPSVVTLTLLMQPTAVPLGVDCGAAMATACICGKTTQPEGGGRGVICLYRKR